MDVAERSVRVTKAGIWIGSTIGIAAIAVTIALVFLQGNSAPPPPVADQWLAIRRNLSNDGWSIRKSRAEKLRDDGRTSTILTLRPSDPKCAKSRSDQVRIYDEFAGRLRETFRFEPTRRGDCNTALNFRVLGVGRFEDDSDTRDLIVAYSTDDAGAQQVDLPLLVTWNPRRSRFEMRGLLRSNSTVSRFGYEDGPLRGTDADWFESAAKLYSEPVALSPKVKAWGASAVSLIQHRDTWSPLIAGVYRLTAGNPAPVGQPGNEVTPVVYQRAVWSLFTTSRGILQGGACTLKRRSVLTMADRLPENIVAQIGRRAGALVASCDVDSSAP